MTPEIPKNGSIGYFRVIFRPQRHCQRRVLWGARGRYLVSASFKEIFSKKFEEIKKKNLENKKFFEEFFEEIGTFLKVKIPESLPLVWKKA